MPRKMFRNLLLASALSLCTSGSALAQGIGGGILGRVKDQSGALVPAALVQLTNTSSGQIRTVSTDNEGRFEASEVSPGLYSVTVLKGGFNTVKVADIRLSVTQVLRLGDITLSVAPVGSETVEVKTAEIDMVEMNSPTLSTAFGQRQIRELPILTRDLNNLALLAPGAVSVRTFSFASTLVPFAVNGSRGRDVNFIIDSVDNNEPLFGGAATQFTNTDLFAEYRILSSQYKAEFGRNSGGVVNIITERGGNAWHGSAFWFAQRDGLNATSLVERSAGLQGPAALSENILGATLGGPIERDSTWLFVSYQWDRARNDLTPLYPQVATLPTVNGLNALSTTPQTGTLAAFLADPTVRLLPTASTRCVGFISGLPSFNPCTIGSIPSGGPFAQPIQFGTYLVPQAGVFDVRDHQFSVRTDHRLTQKDDISVRYLFDDLLTPRTAGAAPIEVGFFDIGLSPTVSDLFAQRTQNAGLFWTHAWPRTLHELRFSYSRIASLSGDLQASELARETLPAVTVFDAFAPNPAPGGTLSGTADFSFAFPAAGQLFTLGSDSRPSRIRGNLYQVQDNFSLSRGRHSLKFGANLVRTLSDIRDIPSDLGEYFYAGTASEPSGFANFVKNSPVFAIQHFGNFGGRGGEVLPIRIFSQFYFAQDDIRVTPYFTLTLGFRYENFGQPVNRLAVLNPSFGGKLQQDNADFGPRVGFALALGSRSVLHGGYGIYYNPAAFNIALIGLQGGRISPFVAGTPTNVYPQPPFNLTDALGRLTDCDSFAVTAGPGPTFADCTTEDLIAKDLVQPRAQNFTLSLERQLGQDVLVQAAYVGNISTQLLERLNKNPRTGWQIQNPCTSAPCPVANSRVIPNRGEITIVDNGARSSYHSLQASLAKRYSRPGFFRGLALTAAYTWSHMIDTASEIFGPQVRRVRNFQALRRNASAVEVITPFAQDRSNPHAGERGNSSFDRRHRASVSAVWSLPSPGSGVARALLGGWGMGGVFTAQTGQPFSPLNSFGACTDSNGDGLLTNDRPSIGDPRAPLDRIALVADSNCVSIAPTGAFPTGYMDVSGNPIDPSTAHFVQVPLGLSPGTQFTVGSSRFTAGNAGRNVLTGPHIVNLDFSIIKNFQIHERRTLQFRIEAYDVLNRANHGAPIGNVYSIGAQPVPALAFGTVLTSPFGGVASPTPARVSGVVPENSLDAFDSNTFGSLFLSPHFMNTSSRKIQAVLKLLF